MLSITENLFSRTCVNLSWQLKLTAASVVVSIQSSPMWLQSFYINHFVTSNIQLSFRKRRIMLSVFFIYECPIFVFDGTISDILSVRQTVFVSLIFFGSLILHRSYVFACINLENNKCRNTYLSFFNVFFLI